MTCSESEMRGDKAPCSGTSILERIAGPADLRGLNDARLAKVADELRAEVIQAVSQTGGHLGSSLGVVELTVALHAVFNTPTDKLIWDVGHQCYPHKVLTGRRDRIRTLRQKDGLSGFTKRDESQYDPFGAAHSSTSISAALGFATARDMGQATGDAIAVIGDGALSAGMAYEAMNNAGQAGRRLFVILNDNEMSIAPPVGAMSAYLSELRKGAEGASFAKDMEALMPPPMRAGARRARALVTGQDQATIFEKLGFDYLGPVDGHDMSALLATLRNARTRARGPVLIHVCTIKGKGYAPAETAACRYHGVSTFDVATGIGAAKAAFTPSYTSVFGHALCDVAARDLDVVAVTAAMPSGTGVDLMAERFPNRVFDVGIAEQHGVTFAAGMAASGLKPVCAIYSTFLQRAYDQVVHDVALQGLPVRFAIDRAGLVGADGATHAGAFDIGYLSSLPGMTVMAAADEAELIHMLETAIDHDAGPIAFRYPRGSGTGVPLPERGNVLRIGQGRVLREGTDLAILSYGSLLAEALMAAELLDGEGISVTVADARFAKPLDIGMLRQLARHHAGLMTLEAGAEGGFGSLVLHALARECLLDGGLKVRTMTLPDRYIQQASPQQMYEDAGLTVSDIAATLRKMAGVEEARVVSLRKA